VAKAPPGLARPPGTTAVARPLQPPRATVRPTGMRRFGLNTKPQIMTGWAWGPPPGFLNGNNSVEEWPVWWALNHELGPPDQGEWTYQTRIAPQLPGGIKPDFVIYQDPPLVFRVQSDRYHLTVDAFKQAYDREQRIQLERMGYGVIDLFPQHYMVDVTYSVAVLAVVREGLQGRQRSDPLLTATSNARA
jgi:hypothetical protein